MSGSLEERKALLVTPPRANGVTGNVAALTVAALTPAFLDLSTLSKGPVPSVVSSTTVSQEGSVGAFLTVQADGADLYLVFGPTQASVTTTAAPVLLTVGTNTSGVYGEVLGTALKVPTGTSLRVLIQNSQDRFMGFVGGGAGTMRLYQSSPGMV
jgi:hypothetical protein